jgi:chromosome partitioning protein
MDSSSSKTIDLDRKRRMRRVVISLLKGGVAKSGTSVSLAHGLAMAGQRVLLVDTDVQAQCSDMLGVHPKRGLAEVVAGIGDPLSALAEARENLWLLAGGNGLAGVKMEIARREMSPETVLAEAMEHYEGGFDFLVIDTAPGWDTLLVNALYCSQEVISPVSMEPMALSGLMRFQERLEVIQKYNPQLELRWIVPTFVDGRVKKTFDILEQLRERYGELIGPEIKYTVKLSEAPAYGKTIYEHDPKGVGAKGYRNLVDLVLNNPPLATQVRTAAVAAGIANKTTPTAQVTPISEKKPTVTEPPVALSRPEARESQKAAPSETPKQVKQPTPEKEISPRSLAARLKEAESQATSPEEKVKVAQLRPEPPTQPSRQTETPEEDSASSRILLSARHFLRERLKKTANAEPSLDASFREIREKYKDGRA